MTLNQNLPIAVGLSGFSPAEDGQRFELFDTSFDPDTQVWDTMPLIRRYVSLDSQGPLVQFVANQYRNNMPGASAAQIAWAAAKDHLIFNDDQSIALKAAPGNPNFVVEVLRRPVDVILYNRRMRRKAEGDCDDFAMFAGSIGAALGATVDFPTVAVNPHEPGVLSHIYTVIDGVPCDASHGPFAGWEVPSFAVSRRVDFSLTGASPLAGLVLLAGLWFLVRSFT